MTKSPLNKYKPQGLLSEFYGMCSANISSLYPVVWSSYSYSLPTTQIKETKIWEQIENGFIIHV